MYSIGHQGALSDCVSTLSVNMMLYPIGTSILTADTMLYPIGTSTLSADTILYPIAQILCRPSGYFIRFRKYSDGRHNALSDRGKYSNGRHDAIFWRNKHSDGRQDAFAK